MGVKLTFLPSGLQAPLLILEIFAGCVFLDKLLCFSESVFS